MRISKISRRIAAAVRRSRNALRAFNNWHGPIVHDDGTEPCGICGTPPEVETCADCGRAWRVVRCLHRHSLEELGEGYLLPMRLGRLDGARMFESLCAQCAAKEESYP